MHEKLVFIDDEVLWHGSLNPLSFSDTQEIMERRHSKAVVEDYQRTLRLEELLGAYEQREAARAPAVLRRRDRCSGGATTLLLALRRGQLLLAASAIRCRRTVGLVH